MTNTEALTHLRQLATELADGPRKKSLELCLTWVGPFEGMVELRSKLAATTLEVEKARDARDAAESALVTMTLEVERLQSELESRTLEAGALADSLGDFVEREESDEVTGCVRCVKAEEVLNDSTDPAEIDHARSLLDYHETNGCIKTPVHPATNLVMIPLGVQARAEVAAGVAALILGDS